MAGSFFAYLQYMQSDLSLVNIILLFFSDSNFIDVSVIPNWFTIWSPNISSFANEISSYSFNLSFIKSIESLKLMLFSLYLTKFESSVRIWGVIYFLQCIERNFSSRKNSSFSS